MVFKQKFKKKKKIKKEEDVKKFTITDDDEVTKGEN